MLAIRSLQRPSATCRAAPTSSSSTLVPSHPLNITAPPCPCVAAVEVFAAKDKCVHPARPVKDACPDCPRRKGKGAVMTAEVAEEPCGLQVFAAKDKCVHPARPVKDACPDCPRRKGKSAMLLAEEQVAPPRRSLSVFAAKDKCVHPARPVKDACPDCPRRKK